MSHYSRYLEEDAPQGDITSQAIFGKSSQRVTAKIIAKQDMVVSGFFVVKELVALKKSLRLKIFKPDGEKVRSQTVLAHLSGRVSDLLLVERVCLNFLQRLSGIATLTYHCVKKAKPHLIQILDTRKTTPGLRMIEKQAVIHGGGCNHRMSLSDQYLIKDNHSDAAGSVVRALTLVKEHQRSLRHKPLIEVEVRSLKEFCEALSQYPDIILLDNMKPELIKRLVKLRNSIMPLHSVKQQACRPLLEISGGVNLENLGMYLKTGVERISLGALTHSAKACDVSMVLL